MTSIIAMLALAVDIGIVAVVRCQAQNAADTAAMAGARTINGNVGTTYNVASVPGQAITAAVANTILGQNVVGDPTNVTTVNSYTFQSGNVKIEVGGYVYVYNDSSPSSEAFQIQFPVVGSSEPYSAVRATVTGQTNNIFAGVFGVSTFNTNAVAVAAHRPRDVMIIMDLSGSMRFQSLPGVPMTNSTTANPATQGSPRAQSMNPDTLFPQFGHYSDTTGAALQGTTSFATTDVNVDPCNISTTSNSGPPIAQDFYANPVGTAPSSSNMAFSAPSGVTNTSPGGDIPLRTSRDTTSTYAQTVAQFNNNSSTTYTAFETSGYTASGIRTQFNGYTQGPGYWGKTFWIWPPAPAGASILSPPSSLTNTTFNWYNNLSNDWRQRFFVGVDSTNGNAPVWINHNDILFTTTGVKTPGTTTSETEYNTGTAVSKTYTFRINYAAILYWLKQSPAPFPSTLQAGRIRYYTTMPDGTDNTLNNRWWTTNPTSLANDERFWKEYIDFVLGYVGTGTNTYSSTQGSVNYSALIGNGDYYTWTGSTVQISNRAHAPLASNPNNYWDTGTVNTAAAKNATTLVINNTSPKPIANSDWIVVTGDTTKYLITAVSGSSNPYTCTVTPALANAAAAGAAISLYSPYMSYTDCPVRPRHQYWFGPMTMIDWLGNYNLKLSTSSNASHEWWPGNCHEAQAWACKVGIQTAINDIQNNHPNDFVGLTFFSSPMDTVSSTTGFHNRGVVSMGRSYQQLTDSLWFPPSTVTGGVSEIGPYDADMNNVPRANGGTAPGMGFMIAYNQFSSSTTNLRFYASPSTTYRGDAGGLGRKGRRPLGDLRNGRRSQYGSNRHVSRLGLGLLLPDPYQGSREHGRHHQCGVALQFGDLHDRRLQRGTADRRSDHGKSARLRDHAQESVRVLHRLWLTLRPG